MKRSLINHPEFCNKKKEVQLAATAKEQQLNL
jgi:hypothetical protein